MKRSVLTTSALLLTGIAGVTGCRTGVPQQQMAPIVDGNAAQSDPTAANLMPSTQGYVNPAYRDARYTPAQTAAPVQQAPSSRGNSSQNEAYRYNTTPPQYSGDPNAAPDDGDNPQMTDEEYDGYADLLDPNVPAATQPPPALPVDYEQPEAPGPDYLWTPGYWDYATAGYYYVPGAWVSAPFTGALWTPGWWGYAGNRYHWHHGYWGRHVGYYGGINYGFGFIGIGYQGGYWNGDHFFYNRAVNRVSPRVVNNYIYERRPTVVNNTYINNTRVSYFGGPGGLRRAPAPQEFAERRENRVPPMQAQIANRQAAQANRQQFFNSNNGRPQMVFASRPIQADRNITPPQRTNFAAPGGFGNGGPGGPGNQGNRGNFSPNAGEQQRGQFDVQRQQMLQNRQANDAGQQQQHPPEQQHAAGGAEWNARSTGAGRAAPAG